MMALALVACDSKKGPDQKPAAVDTVAKVAPPSAPSPEHSLPNANPQIDTTDGTITVTGTGAASNTWSFTDVNATVDESAGGGATQGVLMIEAHDAINGRHLRLRLLHDGGPVDPGTYPVDAAKGGRRVEPRWEMEHKAFRALQGGRGSVVLKSFTGDRAVGTFDITLPSLDDPSVTETLKGHFDQLVRH
jgi:hypothetical protein